MIVYSMAFLVSIGIACIGKRVPSRYAWLVAVLTALPLCAIAGFRDLTVGTDTSGYPLRCYQASMVYSLPSTLTICADQELLYVCFVWVVSRLTGSFNTMLFICELFIVFPYCLVARRLFAEGFPLAMAFFCLVLFGYSLNIMRQMMSISMLLMMFYMLVKEKPEFAALFLLIGIGIHRVAIAGVLIWIGWIACRRAPSMTFLGNVEGRNKKSIAMLVVLGALFALICCLIVGPNLMRLVASITTLYSYQVAHAGMGDFNTTMILYGLVSGMLFLCYSKDQFAERRDCEQRTIASFLLLMTLLAAVFAQCSSISPELIRVSFPFLAFSGLYFAFLYEADERGRPFILVVSTLLFLAYFFITYVRGGSCDLLPYTSQLLGLDLG